MAYTPIEWDEVTPITPANLNKMDNQIDDNDGRITTNDGKITTNEGDITDNNNDINNLQNVSQVSYSGESSIFVDDSVTFPYEGLFLIIDSGSDRLAVTVNGNSVLTKTDSISAVTVFSTGSNVVLNASGAETHFYRRITLK